MPDYLQSNPLTKRIIKKWISADPSIVENLPNVIQVTRTEAERADKFYLIDNGILREMIQVEKDALLAEEAQAEIDAENSRVTDLDNKINDTGGITLSKIDTAIDAIGTLTDAKAFLKKLCRYIIKYTAGGSR